MSVIEAIISGNTFHWGIERESGEFINCSLPKKLLNLAAIVNAMGYMMLQYNSF